MMLKTRQCFYIPEVNMKTMNAFLIRHGFGPNNFNRAVKDSKGDVYYICNLVVTDSMAETLKSKFATLFVSKSAESAVRLVKGFTTFARAAEIEE